MHFKIVPVTAFQQNCTFVRCDKTHEAAVIDPGGDLEQLLEIIKTNNYQIKKILLTHGHIDHVGATAPLSRALDVPVIGPHPEDLFWIEQAEQQSSMLGLPPVEFFTPTQWLDDEQQVSVGELKFDVIHCPGHTPGHVVFYNKEAGWAQVGDVIFAGSIGRTDFPKGNLDQLTHSIREKLFPLGDNIEFVPGHGPMSTFGQERKTNPFVADHRFG